MQRKPQSSTLKLMNSVLWGRNRWKASPCALVALASDMIWVVLFESRNCGVSHIGFQKTLRLNVKRLRNKMRMI
jgi:hypothetical protein